MFLRMFGGYDPDAGHSKITEAQLEHVLLG